MKFEPFQLLKVVSNIRKNLQKLLHQLETCWWNFLQESSGESSEWTHRETLTGTTIGILRRTPGITIELSEESIGEASVETP